METLTADRWLYTTLAGDATLGGLVTGVYSWPVPPSAALPYVLFQEQSALDVTALGPHRLWVNGLWLVRVVAEARGWGGSLETAANRIDALLQAASGAVASPAGVVWACWRVQPFRLVETVQSRDFRHLGGIYRVYVA